MATVLQGHDTNGSKGSEGDGGPEFAEVGKVDFTLGTYLKTNVL